MIVKSAQAKTVEMLEGVWRKNLALGEKMMLCEFTFQKGAIVPAHTHPHEQVGYVVKGKVKLRIGEKKYLLGTGDSYYIKPNIDHSAELIEESIIIDVFCPPREDYR
ncbi:MAG: cupin domain-containing protein [Candidatus Jordarchaeum sp.]|uniref:cupin domain-containing protein n=1 Tax=Candidatus Jordarchaeum sp. TaxID=2823881 RepID=UPI00404B9444